MNKLSQYLLLSISQLKQRQRRKKPQIPVLSQLHIVCRILEVSSPERHQQRRVLNLAPTMFRTFLRPCILVDITITSIYELGMLHGLGDGVTRSHLPPECVCFVMCESHTTMRRSCVAVYVCTGCFIKMYPLGKLLITLIVLIRGLWSHHH